MAWTPLIYDFGSLLTATKMTQNQANFLSLAAGDSGAPTIVGSNVTGILGSWISKTFSLSHVASMDGFVTAYAKEDLSGTELRGFTDGSNPPTTVRQDQTVSDNAEYASVSFPVRKGDYYKVLKASGGADDFDMFFIPIGI